METALHYYPLCAPAYMCIQYHWTGYHFVYCYAHGYHLVYWYHCVYQYQTLL